MFSVTAYMDALVSFAVNHGLIEEEDRAWTMNALLEKLQMDAPENLSADEQIAPLPETITPVLEGLIQYARDKGIIPEGTEAADLFGTSLCGCITPSPELVRNKFHSLYTSVSPVAATNWFYQICRACDYIRVDRIAKNIRYFANTSAGNLEITINLSKPEKDPKDIARALKAKNVSYPKCMLCAENPGYAGRANFPARQNHRLIPLELEGSRFYLQYSPYLYYPEHCIVLNQQHIPMHIDEITFRRLFSFVEQFPHYFIGSNADLPIVGGSILTHDHFQGGNYTFPMDHAALRIPLHCPEPGVTGGITSWPMTCIRLFSTDKEALIRSATSMLGAWRAYSDPSLGILAFSGDTPHNTITPIVRRQGNNWCINLVLRNNRTDEENTLGIFHPHKDLHHIKKENIGLIEVMGLFILPGRLKTELASCADCLTGKRSIQEEPAEDDPLFKHFSWVQQLYQEAGGPVSQETADQILKEGVAKKCTRVLEDAGVFKQDTKGTAGLLRFLSTIGYTQA